MHFFKYIEKEGETEREKERVVCKYIYSKD